LFLQAADVRKCDRSMKEISFAGVHEAVSNLRIKVDEEM